VSDSLKKKIWNLCPFFPGIGEKKIANCYRLLEIAEEKIATSAKINSAIISSLKVFLMHKNQGIYFQ